MKMKKMMTLAAIAATLVSCGGGGGRPQFGDNEYPVVAVGTSSADMQSTYPATIKGVQDVEIRPKVQGFMSLATMSCRQLRTTMRLLRLSWLSLRPLWLQLRNN